MNHRTLSTWGGLNYTGPMKFTAQGFSIATFSMGSIAFYFSHPEALLFGLVLFVLGSGVQLWWFRDTMAMGDRLGFWGFILGSGAMMPPGWDFRWGMTLFLLGSISFTFASSSNRGRIPGLLFFVGSILAWLAVPPYLSATCFLLGSLAPLGELRRETK